MRQLIANSDGMVVLDISSNDAMHFAWYKNGNVSAGESGDLSSMRAPYGFKLARGYSLSDVVAISSNNGMCFAWYKDGKVSSGVSEDLDSIRDPYPFALASGYTLADVVAISSNDTMHFAWYSDGKVSAGTSDNLGNVRPPYVFKLAPGYTLADVVAISSNNTWHFAWYSDGKVSCGTSDDLASFRAPYFFDLAPGYQLVDIVVNNAILTFSERIAGPQNAKVGQTSIQYNRTSLPQQEAFTYGETYFDTYEFSLTQGLGISVSTAVEVEGSFVSASVDFTAAFQLDTQKTWTSSVERNWNRTSTITVAPNKGVQVDWSLYIEEDATQPFTLIAYVSGRLGNRPLTGAEIGRLLTNQGCSGDMKIEPQGVTVTLVGTVQASTSIKFVSSIVESDLPS